jgi:hypothetical protein
MLWKAIPTQLQEENFIDFLTLEDMKDTLSRNVGKVLPLDAP